ncbi:prolipoprotein diacylglyceryl transferase [bacterium]|nr:prolipoprotein diacylglyceryl transferase [bacterium]
MKKIWEAWKVKWKVESDRRMLWIFLIFAITGTSTVFVRKFIFKILGIEISQPVMAFLVKFVAIYLVYQLMLFIVGSLLGEFKFVSWFIAKMNKRLIPGRK